MELKSRPRLLMTQPHACSYLTGQDASTLFVDPAYPVDLELYSLLTAQGFRRSGNYLYRPRCEKCQACIPLRIPIQRFTYSRQQRRTCAHNQDLRIEIPETINSGEHYHLYERYIGARHHDGDMFPPNREQYESFLGLPDFDREGQITHYIEFRLEHRLLAVAVTDILTNGLSAVYTYYDPDEEKRSLGVYAVLFQVEMARRLRLPHLYLGYWIKASPKMAYKSNFKPHELFQNQRWTLVGEN